MMMIVPLVIALRRRSASKENVFSKIFPFSQNRSTRLISPKIVRPGQVVFIVVLMAVRLSIESTSLPPKVIHTKCWSDLLLFSLTKDFLSDRLIFQLRKGSFHERCFIFYVSKLHLWRHTIDNFIVIIVVEGLQDWPPMQVTKELPVPLTLRS